MHKVSQLGGCSLEIPKKYIIKLLRKLGKSYTLLEKKKKTQWRKVFSKQLRVFFQPFSFNQPINITHTVKQTLLATRMEFQWQPMISHCGRNNKGLKASQKKVK